MEILYNILIGAWLIYTIRYLSLLSDFRSTSTRQNKGSGDYAKSGFLIMGITGVS